MTDTTVKRNRRWGRCTRKRPFARRAEAAAHNTGQHPYRCTYCDQWHLTSQAPR